MLGKSSARKPLFWTGDIEHPTSYFIYPHRENSDWTFSFIPAHLSRCWRTVQSLGRFCCLVVTQSDLSDVVWGSRRHGTGSRQPCVMYGASTGQTGSGFELERCHRSSEPITEHCKPCVGLFDSVADIGEVDICTQRSHRTTSAVKFSTASEKKSMTWQCFWARLLDQI